MCRPSICVLTPTNVFLHGSDLATRHSRGSKALLVGGIKMWLKGNSEKVTEQHGSSCSMTVNIVISGVLYFRQVSIIVHGLFCFSNIRYSFARGDFDSKSGRASCTNHMRSKSHILDRGSRTAGSTSHVRSKSNVQRIYPRRKPRKLQSISHNHSKQ